MEDELVHVRALPLYQLGISEQIAIGVRVAAAINPKTGFILIDGAKSLGRDGKTRAGRGHERSLRNPHRGDCRPLAFPIAGASSEGSVDPGPNPDPEPKDQGAELDQQKTPGAGWAPKEQRDHIERAKTYQLSRPSCSMAEAMRATAARRKENVA